MYCIFYQVFNLFFHSILWNIQRKVYISLENEFTKNITKDLYLKIDKLPSKAFEEIGIGEFINRLYTDPDRIMSLLNQMVTLIARSIVAIFAAVLAFSISLILWN